MNLSIIYSSLFIHSNYTRVGEISNNIIDQLYFLQDVLNIQVDCVNTYLKDVLLKEFVIKYCYEQLIPQANPPTVWLIMIIKDIGTFTNSYCFILINFCD